MPRIGCLKYFLLCALEAARVVAFGQRFCFAAPDAAPPGLFLLELVVVEVPKVTWIEANHGLLLVMGHACLPTKDLRLSVTNCHGGDISVRAKK